MKALSNKASGKDSEVSTSQSIMYHRKILLTLIEFEYWK